MVGVVPEANGEAIPIRFIFLSDGAGMTGAVVTIGARCPGSASFLIKQLPKSLPVFKCQTAAKM